MRVTASIFVEVEVVLEAEYIRGDLADRSDDELQDIQIGDLKVNGDSITSGHLMPYIRVSESHLLEILGDSVNEPLFSAASE